ncbi:alkaline phosphatase family protein, partial [Caballeronia sp. M23-90]
RFIEDNWLNGNRLGGGSFDATAGSIMSLFNFSGAGSNPKVFIVISPWAKVNYVDHTQISQASVTRFIEDNWLNGNRLGGGSFDATAGSIMSLFNFSGAGSNPKVFIDQNLGTPVASVPAI